MAGNKCSLKKPPEKKRPKDLRLKWAKNYIKTDMKCVLFTNESRATLDGPDGWSKGWVFHGDQCPTRMRRQLGKGGS